MPNIAVLALGFLGRSLTPKGSHEIARGFNPWTLCGILGGIDMRTLCAALLGVCVVVFAGTARADDDDNAKKLLGVWVIDKSGSMLPEGSTVEFIKDGKLKVILKDKSGDMNFSGTYKLAKDKLTTIVNLMGKDVEDILTIKKLTDEALEVEDKDGTVDTFKKKK
jgi:uncharacterized protein (TIGR03066 family)